MHRPSHYDVSTPAAAHAALLRKRDELAETLSHLAETEQRRDRDRDWIDVKPAKAPARPDVEDADLRSVMERELKQVHHALQRQDAGLYGVCEACGGPIDHGRLMAIPEVTTCNHCAAGRLA